MEGLDGGGEDSWRVIKPKIKNKKRYLLDRYGSGQSKRDTRNELLTFARNHSRRTFLNLGRVVIRTRIIDINISTVLLYCSVFQAGD